MLRCVRSSKVYAASLLATIILTSTAQAASPLSSKPKQAADLGKTKIKDTVAADYATIAFKPGKAHLSDEARSKIETLLKAQDVSYRSLDVQLAGYADHDYVSSATTEATAESVALAKQRIDAVETYLNHLGSFASLENFNMARPVSWLDKIIESDKQKLTEGMSGKKFDEQSLNRFAMILQKNGKSGVVVLFVTPNADALAH